MEYKPHNYQLYNIERIVADPAVGLFLRPGLGKTSITLTAIGILKLERWQICRALVVAPKKVAEGTWQKEAAKWDHLRDLRIVTVLGSQARRIKALSTPGDVYVINRENVPWLVEYYGRQPWPFDMLILDESTSFKNARSQRFRGKGFGVFRVAQHVPGIAQQFIDADSCRDSVASPAEDHGGAVFSELSRQFCRRCRPVRLLGFVGFRLLDFRVRILWLDFIFILRSL